MLVKRRLYSQFFPNGLHNFTKTATSGILYRALLVLYPVFYLDMDFEPRFLSHPFFRLCSLPSRALGARVTIGILVRSVLSGTLPSWESFMVSGISSGTFRHRIKNRIAGRDTIQSYHQRQHVCSKTILSLSLCSLLSPRNFTLALSIGYQIVHIYPGPHS
jgi:hypothetical protein